jgi:hypothetical protein
MMKKWMVALVLLFFFGGICLIGVGSGRLVWHIMTWGNAEREEIAEDICRRSDETLRITRTQRIGGRTYYDFYCDDAQGNTRNIGDELGDADPAMDDTKVMLAGVGGILLGIFIAIVGVRRQVKFLERQAKG